MVSNVLSSPNMAIPKNVLGEGDSDISFSCDRFLEYFEIFARHEVFSIENLSQLDWRKPIIEYLENPIGNTNRKIKNMALSYIRLGNELLKKTSEGILLKCLGNTEAYLTISEVHSGAFGAHQEGHKMIWLLFHQGVYWPSMLKVCIEFAKGCKECHMRMSVQHVLESELHAIIKPWPFRGWELGVIGEIRPASSKQQKFILVRIYYFTKWIEAIPFVKVDQEAVIEFIWKYIVYRFGISETITTYQGSVFMGQKMQEFIVETCFKLVTSTPYYAQENGQVEASNKVIISLIRKHIAKKPKNWHKTLDQILWTCRTSLTKEMNLTPFRLTFGHDAVLPAEICLQSVRVQRQNDIQS